jgi:hypothetical protein
MAQKRFAITKQQRPRGWKRYAVLPAALESDKTPSNRAQRRGIAKLKKQQTGENR